MSLTTKAVDMFTEAKQRTDAYVNALKGLGDALYDSLAQTKVRAAFQGDSAYYENLIEVNRLARRIAALPPREMLRAGYEIQVPDDAAYDSKPLMKEIKRLQLDANIVWAMTLARATGGAVLVPVMNDGAIDLRLPLNLQSIREIQELRVVSRKHVQQTAPGSPIYRITTKDNSSSIEMHESRLLIFHGERITDERRNAQGGWHNSIFVALEEPLARHGTTWQALGNMFVDGSQGVLKIKGLHGLISAFGEGLDALRARFHVMAHGRSVARAVAVDADGEDFTFVNRQFAGIDGAIYALMSELSSLTGIPITKLFGRSAAGMNATGEGDARDWLNEVEADRTVELEPNHEKALRWIMHTKAGGGEPASWSVAYKPGWQPSEKEQAEVRKIQADVDAIYLGQQVLLPEEVALSRFGGKEYSTRTTIDQELRAQLDQVDPGAHDNGNVQGDDAAKDRQQDLPR